MEQKERHSERTANTRTGTITVLSSYLGGGIDKLNSQLGITEYLQLLILMNILCL